MNIDNIKPIYSEGSRPVFKAAFGLLSFPFGQLVASFAIAFSNFKHKHSSYKIYITGLLMGAFLLLINSLNTLLVLGIHIASNLHYLSYIAVSRINIGNFVKRAEVIIAISFILGGFVKISILLCTCKGIAKIFNFSDYKFIVIPITLLAINLSYFQYDSILSYSEFTIDIWPYFIFPFQTFLPIIIWITAEIKKNRTQC